MNSSSPFYHRFLRLISLFTTFSFSFFSLSHFLLYCVLSCLSLYYFFSLLFILSRLFSRFFHCFVYHLHPFYYRFLQVYYFLSIIYILFNMQRFFSLLSSLSSFAPSLYSLLKSPSLLSYLSPSPSFSHFYWSFLLSSSLSSFLPSFLSFFFFLFPFYSEEIFIFFNFFIYFIFHIFYLLYFIPFSFPSIIFISSHLEFSYFSPSLSLLPPFLTRSFFLHHHLLHPLSLSSSLSSFFTSPEIRRKEKISWKTANGVPGLSVGGWGRRKGGRERERRKD